MQEASNISGLQPAGAGAPYQNEDRLERNEKLASHPFPLTLNIAVVCCAVSPLSPPHAAFRPHIADYGSEGGSAGLDIGSLKS